MRTKNIYIRLLPIAMSMALISTNALSKNTEIPNNQANCPQVKGMSTVLEEMIANTVKTSMDSVNFLRSEYSVVYGCQVVVDTPKGIKRCSFRWILKPDSGTAFAATPNGPGGMVPCQ